ncbi:TolC family protein [Hydrogenovibrio halophilus]|uniref:TolC family protein n=1 Tax=Hydrogenovibrio halophilus TaxID=373391 RepID=UPI00038180EC|nr:TolC family protein [Hydrogenovibrio halophilus]
MKARLHALKRLWRPETLALCAALSFLPAQAQEAGAEKADADAAQTGSENPAAAAKDPTPTLPAPLTLSAVLSLPDRVSPAVVQAQARKALRASRRDERQADNGVDVGIEGRLGWRDYQNETQDHHRLALHLGKELYDFGRTEQAALAEDTLMGAEDLRYQDRLWQFRVRAMKAYFDIILADFQYRIDNEAMAVAYIDFDKARDRHELSRISDVEFLRLEAEYEKVLTRRTRSEYEQRRTREHLANLAGQPGQLPDKVRMPELAFLAERSLKSLEAYQQAAVEDNLEIRRLRTEIEALQHRLQSESAADTPTFRADAWGGKLSSYPDERHGNWEFGLSMHYPLYDGGTRKARMQSVRAEIKSLQAERRLTEQTLRDQVAEVYFDLQLAKAQARQNERYSDYAELYFEFSRGMYENEMQTDLGDSMVKLSQSTYNIMRQRFEETLDWARLDHLTGQSLAVSQYQ